MTILLWLVLLGFLLTLGWLVWYSRRKLAALRTAEEARFANFLSGTAGRSIADAPPNPASLPAIPSPPGAPGVAQQKLLFEAAHKAGEAGEPALAIQLYARLLARFPDSTFAAAARNAVELQKKKLAKA
jgi:outer membrane protein assembly factor BamD (BamD/ComL family)